MKKKSKKMRFFFLIVFILALISLSYQFLLRPILKKSMGTEVVSLGITFIILVGIILTLVVTLALALYLILLKINKVKNRRRWSKRIRKSISILVLLLIVLVGFTYYSQKNAYIKPLCNEYNDIIPASVASLEKVYLKDDNEWITVKGKDKNNPILLVLGDGPGKSQMAYLNKSLEFLQDDFLVVTWDMLGTGKSYKKVDDLSVDRYVSDGIELTKYLCEKYNKEKIYILGNSFGSTLGMLMLRDNPDLYQGFIGTSTLVSVKRNEEYRYNRAYEIAENNSDEKQMRVLKAQGQPAYDKKMYKKQKVYYDYLKNEENMKNEKQVKGNAFDIFSSEYGLLDKINLTFSEKKTYDRIFKSYYDVDLINSVKEVKVPVYFIQGSRDYLVSSDILNEYFTMLNAPDKQIIWFENSGSMPWISEQEEFARSIKNRLLNK